MIPVGAIYSCNNERIVIIFLQAVFPSGNAINYNFDKTAPEVTIDDFSARFGLGYMFGAGYQLTPASQLDLRVVQTLLDNASGRGANRVSNTLYKSPSLQLTYSYRFSSNRPPRKAR